MARVNDVSDARPASSDPTKEKKKKKSRGFGDEATAARVKRDRRMERAAEMGALKRSQFSTRRIDASPSSAPSRSKLTTRSRNGAKPSSTRKRSPSLTRSRSIKEIAKDVGDMRKSRANIDHSSRDVEKGKGGGVKNSLPDESPSPSKAEEGKKTRRCFGDEVQKAKDKKEHKLDRARENILKMETGRERGHLVRSKSLSRCISRSLSRRSLSRSRASPSGGRKIGRAQSVVIRTETESHDKDSVSDSDNLWRDGEWKKNAENDSDSSAKKTSPLRGGVSGTHERQPVEVGSGTSPGHLRETTGGLGSLLGWAGLTEEVETPAGGGLPGDPRNSDRPTKLSAQCRAMEEEIVRMKLQIAQAKGEEETERLKFRQFTDEKRQLGEELTQIQNSVREVNKMTRNLNHQLERLRKYNAELVPQMKKLKVEVWRMKKDRDELRQMSYESAGDPRTERIMKVRDWLVDDLATEELAA